MRGRNQNMLSGPRASARARPIACAARWPAGKRNGGLQGFEHRLVEGMRARGYSERFARQMYKQIEGFGEYGFPERHAASFALLVYVSTFIGCLIRLSRSSCLGAS